MSHTPRVTQCGWQSLGFARLTGGGGAAGATPGRDGVHQTLLQLPGFLLLLLQGTWGHLLSQPR